MFDEIEFARLVAERFDPNYRLDTGGDQPRDPRRVRKILKGEFYVKKSKIPPRKSERILGRILGKTVSPLRGREYNITGGEIMPPLFVMGYKVSRGILYEIWYDPYKDTYVIIDNYSQQHGSYRELYNAAQGLIELIALEEDLTPEEKAEVERHKDAALRMARREQVNKMRSMLDHKLAPTDRYMLTESEAKEISKIMSGSSSAEQLLTNLPGVEKYDRTKLSYSGMKKIARYLGKRMETPMSVIGHREFRRIEFDDANGYFIAGFSLPLGPRSIDLEIWYLQEPGKKPMFYVYNVTSYKLIGQVAKLRNAYALVAKVLGKEITDV